MKVLDKSNLIFYLVLISIVCFLVFIDFSFVNDFIFYIVYFPRWEYSKRIEI